MLSKKRESPSSGEAEKLMPLDALGIVMVTHGEEYGDDSAYGTCGPCWPFMYTLYSTVVRLTGTCLVALGRAHCKIAMLQEAYGLTFQDTFIASCEKFAQNIKDYEYQRKKLDSRRWVDGCCNGRSLCLFPIARRLSYDAAINKLEKLKGCKKEKEKERREAEDELQRCRLRL